MVTANSLRRFSVACMDWAEQAKDASRRQIIVEVAHSWANIAAAIESCGKPVSDLRTKLN